MKIVYDEMDWFGRLGWLMGWEVWDLHWEIWLAYLIPISDT